MAKTMLVVFILMNDGTVEHDISEHEIQCPHPVVVEAKYTAKKRNNEIKDYAASCVTIKFDTPEEIGV